MATPVVEANAGAEPSPDGAAGPYGRRWVVLGVRQDLCDYVSDFGRALSEPRARQVLSALIAEASANPELSHALRQRVGEPRRRELADRLRADGSQLSVPVEVAIDLLVGPVYHRALVVDEGPVDPALVDAVVDAVVARS